MDRGVAARFRPPHSPRSHAAARRSRDRAGDRCPRAGGRRGQRDTTTGSMRTAATAILAIAAMPASLLGQQRWEQQVQDRLARAVEALPATPTLPVVKRSGTLNTDEGAWFQTTLVEGTSYAIVAVCDDDCSRLQLTLLSPSGSDIAKERNSESLPTLHFTAEITAVYSIRVVMEGCRWNPCWYAVAVVPLGKNPP